MLKLQPHLDNPDPLLLRLQSRYTSRHCQQGVPTRGFTVGTVPASLSTKAVTVTALRLPQCTVPLVPVTKTLYKPCLTTVTAMHTASGRFGGKLAQEDRPAESEVVFEFGGANVVSRRATATGRPQTTTEIHRERNDSHSCTWRKQHMLSLALSTRIVHNTVVQRPRCRAQTASDVDWQRCSVNFDPFTGIACSG